METEHSVPCVVRCAAAEAVSGSSSTNNNNNIVVKSDYNQQSSNATNNAIVIDDGEPKSTEGSSVAIENCDNGDGAVAVAFAEIHLNNNESIIGFVDDEDEAVGEANAVHVDEGACCKPDANNCGIDAVAVEDGKLSIFPSRCSWRSRAVNLFFV